MANRINMSIHKQFELTRMIDSRIAAFGPLLKQARASCAFSLRSRSPAIDETPKIRSDGVF